MFQPIPGTLQYNTLIANIEQGIVKIPQFQRKFVWSIEQTAKLLDSILKGYPIGSFILWETKERLRSIRDIGNIQLPEPPEGYIVQYVLDGQQRMTSLYVSMIGAKITGDDKRTIDYSEIYVDFEAASDEEIVITDIGGRNMGELIKFTDLLNGGYKMFAKYPTYGEKLERYSNAFKTYLFSTILIKDAPIDIATEIFTRINVGGKPLSVFEIMVAKTYDSVRNFDLSEKYDALMEHLQSSNCNYDTISSSTILQAVSVCLTKECSKKQILKLNKDDFINIWDKVISALESAVDYFRSFYRIPVSQLLPYDSLLVPFTYFFFHHKDIPLDQKQDFLQDYFWRVVLTSRFSTSLEAKIGQDIRKIDLILSNQRPSYDEPVDITPEYFSSHGWFATGTAYIKGFLCILAYQQPKSFANNALVNINNSWLKQANSKNYHHFFPKAYLAKRNFENWEINHIANITIVDDFLNKRSIRDRAPSKYISDYQKINPDLEATLATHLIGPIEESGIINNDYDKFFNHRLQKFSDEFRKRLILQSSDHS